MMPLAPLAPEERATLEAVADSLGRSGDATVHEVALRLGTPEELAGRWLEGLAGRGVLERVDQSPLFAGMDVPAVYSIADRLAHEYGVAQVPQLTSLDELAFEPVESFAYPDWVQALWVDGPQLEH